MTEIIETKSASSWIPSSVEELFCAARNYVSLVYPEQLKYYRELNLDDMTPLRFWDEYVWVVYASGFNAKVLSKKYPAIMEAAGDWDTPLDKMGVYCVIANDPKLDALIETKSLLQDMGWDKFKETYCDSVDSLAKLKYVGSITKFHLARNLGFDAVKPDLHLVRVSSYFGFFGPNYMCQYLANGFNERTGVVDYILWCFLASYGSKQYEVDSGDR